MDAPNISPNPHRVFEREKYFFCPVLCSQLQSEYSRRLIKVCLWKKKKWSNKSFMPLCCSINRGGKVR